MGCSSSKPEDVSDGKGDMGDAQPNFNQQSKRVIQDMQDKVIKPLGQVVDKVASLALDVPKSLGQNIRTHAHHLKNVFVPPIAADDLKGFTLPVYPKLDEEKQFILKSLSDNFIFANLEKREMNAIIDAFEKTEFNDGSEILKQGDETADFFYIIYQGDVTYHVDGKEVGSSGAGKSFGELALLYSCPRAATVKAKGKCTLFRVDQKSFRSVLQKRNMQTAEQKLSLLKKIEFLKDMELYDLQKLSSAMVPVNFEPGDFLVKKGEAGDAFFLIQEGQVKVTDISVGSSKFEDTTLGEGDYFGERALITSEPRAANVIGTTKGIAMSIDKDTFEMVLGNFSRLIIKSQDKRMLAAIKIIHDTYLETSTLDTLSNHVEDQKFTKGTVIMKEGNSVEASLYLVREGQVKISSKDGTMDSIVGKGAYFGEDMLSLDVQYTAEAVDKGAVTDTSTINSEFLLQKPTTTKSPYTVTVLDDVTCGVLSLKTCRGIVDTSTFGRGKKRSSAFSASVIERKTELKDLKKHVMLGTGTFGQVWLVSMEGISEKAGAYALKVQAKAELIQAHQAKGVVQEMSIMKQLNHPLLLRLVKTFQDDDMVYMLLGLVQGGELFNRIHTNVSDGVPEATAKFYAAGVYEALAYMHRRQIIYRDLKPENVLIDTKGYPIVVDFGFAKKITDKTYTFCGTPLYLAPEVILNRGHNFAADIWSVGVLINEMITGDTPFYKEGMDQLDLYRQICSAKYEPHPMLDGKADATDIIAKMLNKIPTQRIGQLKNGQQDIFQHPWFAEISFEKLRAKEIEAPWIPKIKDPLDSSNFDSWRHVKDKTKQKWPKLSPEQQAIFLGF